MELLLNSQLDDETLSLPPPLTMEELMLEHSQISQSATELSNLASRQNQRHDDVLESNMKQRFDYSFKNSAPKYHLSDPVALCSAMHLTSSPSKKSTTFQLSPIHSSIDNSCRRSDVDNSIAKLALQSSSHEFHQCMNNDDGVQECREYAVDDQRANDGATGISFDDETLPSTAFQDCSATNLLDISPQRPISARSNATSVTLTATDVMSDQWRSKLVVLHSDNARLRTLVSQLREELDTCKVKANSISNANQDLLSERIVSLLDEVKSNEKTLRSKEDELEYREKESAGKDEVICGMKKKLVYFQTMLKDSCNQKTKAEAMRDAARCEAALLSQKMQGMHAQVAAKLQHSQNLAVGEMKKLKEDKVDVMRKHEALKREHDSLKVKLRASLRRLKFAEDLNQSQDMSSATLMDEAQQRIRELIEELDEKRFSLKKCKADLSVMRDSSDMLKKHHEGLKEQSAYQTAMLESCQKEKEHMKVENESLRTSISQLKQELQAAHSLPSHAQCDVAEQPIKETSEVEPRISPRKHRSALSELTSKLAAKENHIRRLEARLASSASDGEKMEALQEELMALGEKHRAGERRANDLEDVVHLMENERTKYLKKVNDLEDHVQDQSRQCESLEKRLHDRTIALNRAQQRSDELDTKVMALEDEVKTKKSELSTLNNDFSKLTNDLSGANSNVSDLQAQLVAKSRALEGVTAHSGKQEAQHRRDVKKMQKVHAEQCEELKEQIDLLHEETAKLKVQLKLAKREVLLLNEQCVASSNRVEKLEAEVTQSRKEEDFRLKGHQEALTILEEKSSVSSSHVHALEETLAQCRIEVSGYVKQLHDAHDDFQHKLTMKSDQVAKLEANLKLARASLQDQGCHSMELEAALEERHKMLADAASRITELEESQALLQEEVSVKEQHHVLEASHRDQLISEMKQKLDIACHELDGKNLAFSKLNDALKKVDEEFTNCKKEVATLEAKVEDLHVEGEKNTQAVAGMKFERDEMKSKLDEKIEQAGAMEASMQNVERQLKKTEEKNANLERELAEAESRCQVMTQQIGKLQAHKDSRDADVIQKDHDIARLQESLIHYRLECDATNESKVELEKLLDDRQSELQQRASQLARLEVQMRGFESGTGKRNNELELALNEVKGQLRERTNQVSGLDNEVTSLRMNVGELRRVAEEQRENIRRLEDKLAEKEERMEELTETVQSDRRSREERHNACIEASQEMRLAREREQETSKQYQECKQELQKLRREKQQLVDDLNDVTADNRSKDDRLLRLTNQLSQFQSEKVAMETRYHDELDQTHRDVIKMRQDHNDEVGRLTAANGELATRSRMIDCHQANDVEEALKRERESRDEARRSKEAMSILEQELTARKQTIEMNNDVIIVKDAEIARLQAQLSSLGREMVVEALPGASSSNLGRRVGVRSPLNNNPVNLQPPWNMDDVTAASLFTGIDSNMTSFAGSFVPIAASTKRHPVDDPSTFVTSSPNQHALHPQDGGVTSGGEDSLYKRVFDDIFPASPDDTLAPPGNGGSSVYSATGSPFGKLDGELYPEKCMAQLQEKLRASERRRRAVSSKLQILKS